MGFAGQFSSMCNVSATDATLGAWGPVSGSGCKLGEWLGILVSVLQAVVVHAVPKTCCVLVLVIVL